MERRTELRFPAGREIQVTVLGEDKRVLQAVLLNVSGRGARIHVPEPVPVDAALSFEWDNAMLLGEVCYCASDAGGFAVGVELRHSLLNLDEVARLRNRILDAFEPRESSVHC
jgi:hypothetical protein